MISLVTFHCHSYGLHLKCGIKGKWKLSAGQKSNVEDIEIVKKKLAEHHKEEKEEI